MARFIQNQLSVTLVYSDIGRLINSFSSSEAKPDHLITHNIFVICPQTLISIIRQCYWIYMYYNLNLSSNTLPANTFHLIVEKGQDKNQPITYGGWDKMATILQMTYSSAFPWMKTLEFFTGICSLGSNWQYGSIGSDNGLAPNRWQAIIWSNDGMFYWCIHASLGPNELTD